MRPVLSNILVLFASMFLMFPVASLAAETERAPATSSADTILAALPKATWIVDGQGKRPIYIFFDPNCPACQMLYKSLRSLIGPHNLQVRWVPVAMVNATSLGKVAAILEAPDPSAALRENEERYAGESYAGGITEQIPSHETERRTRANERLLNKLDIPVVPSMLFADKNGRAVLIQGALSPLALGKVFKRLP